MTDQLKKSGRSVCLVGQNAYGQFGAPDQFTDSESSKFIKINYNHILEETQSIARVVCGGWHMAILTDDGKVFTCGSNDNCQTGHENNSANNQFSSEDINFPKKITEIKEPVVDVVLGGDHSFFITESGDIWGCGRAGEGQFGLGSSKPNAIKLQRIEFRGVDGTIQQIAAGKYATLVLTERGQVYGAGDFGEFGQDSVGERNENDENDDGWKLIEMPKMVRRMVLHPTSIAMFFFMWDDSIYLLGKDFNSDPVRKPVEVHFSKPAFMVDKIFSGSRFCVVLYDDHSATIYYTFSDGPKAPIQFKGPILDAVCGKEHAIILEDSQTVITLGDDTWGQLGIANRPVQSVLQQNRVNIPEGGLWNTLASGSTFSVVYHKSYGHYYFQKDVQDMFYRAQE